MYKYILFLFLLAQLPSSLYSLESREYFYIQYNLKYNIYNQLNQTFRSTDATTGEVTVRNIKTTLDPLVPSYNGSLYVGWHFENNYSVEFEFADNDIFYSKVDGEQATGFDSQATTIRNYYYMVNIKKDLFDIGNENHIIYSKFGFGFTQLDAVERASGEGGNRLDPAVQIGMGYTYVWGQFIDIDTQIRYFTNFARLEELAGYSFVGFKGQMHDVALFVGIKFKVL